MTYRAPGGANKGFSFNKFRLLWVTCEWKGLRPAAADDGAAPDD